MPHTHTFVHTHIYNYSQNWHLTCYFPLHLFAYSSLSLFAWILFLSILFLRSLSLYYTTAYLWLQCKVKCLAHQHTSTFTHTHAHHHQRASIKSFLESRKSRQVIYVITEVCKYDLIHSRRYVPDSRLIHPRSILNWFLSMCDIGRILYKSRLLFSTPCPVLFCVRKTHKKNRHSVRNSFEKSSRICWLRSDNIIGHRMWMKFVEWARDFNIDTSNNNNKLGSRVDGERRNYDLGV